MSLSRTTIAYDGPALKEGLMDVRELAPALLSIGNLCEEAGKLLNGDRVEVAVRVQAGFEAGSFEIGLNVVQSLPDQIRAFLTPEGMTFHDAKEILEYLGLISKVSVAGFAGIAGSYKAIKSVLRLVRWLRGLRPKSVEPAGDDAPGHMLVENQFGEHAFVNNGTIILFNDETIRRELARVVKPLEKEGIEVLEVRDPETKQPFERVEKQEVPIFRSIAGAEIAVAEIPVFVNETEGLFQLVSPVFREDNKWKLSGGQGDFWAEIADLEFQDRVHRREQLFGEGDFLKCRYRSVSYRDGEKIRTEITILKVHDVIPPGSATQISLT